MDNRIPLGDAVEHLTKYLYLDLEGLVVGLKNEDPEYRTQQFRAYLRKARKILCQLHCIIKWLKKSNIKTVFTHSKDLMVNLQAMKDSLVIGQDNLFYIHRDLYPKRSRCYEATIAKELLCRGSYPFLPDAIVSVGMAGIPVLWSNQLTVKDLNISILSKVLLHDPVPRCHQYIRYLVEDGKLVITFDRLYRLHITLADLDDEAHWIVLGCQLLVDSNPDHNFLPSYDSAVMETALLEIIRHQSSLHPGITLLQLHQLAYHFCLATALRLFYIQAMDQSRTLWKGFLEVEFSDIVIDNPLFLCRFWKGQISHEYQYELRVIQHRKIDVSRQQGVVYWELRVLDDKIIHDVTGVGSYISCGNSELHGSLAIEDYIYPYGVSFSSLLDNILTKISEYRLRIVYHRLMLSSQLQAGLTKGFEVKLHDMALTISYGSDSSCWAKIEVLKTSGTVLVTFSKTIEAVQFQAKAAIKQFVDELNNLDIESLTRQVLMNKVTLEDEDSGTAMAIEEDSRSMVSSAVTAALFRPLTTLSPILSLLIAAQWERLHFLHSAGTHCLSPLVNPFFKYLALEYSANNYIGLVYNIENYHSWEGYGRDYLPGSVLTPKAKAILNLDGYSGGNGSRRSMLSSYYSPWTEEMRAIPDISVYLMVVLPVNDPFRPSAFALIANRHQMSYKILDVPNVTHTQSLDTSSLSLDSLYRHSLSQFAVLYRSLEREYLSYRASQLIPAAAVMDKEREEKENQFHFQTSGEELFFPHTVAADSPMAAFLSIAVEDCHSIAIDICLVPTAVTDETLARGLQESATNPSVKLSKEASLSSSAAVTKLGTYHISFMKHPSSASYHILCRHFTPSCSSSDSSWASESAILFQLFAEKLFQTHIVTDCAVDDSDEENNENLSDFIAMEEFQGYEVKFVREKLLLTISRILPLLIFTWCCLQDRNTAASAATASSETAAVEGQLTIVPTVVYQDQSAPHMMYNVLSSGSSSQQCRYLDVSIETQLSKNRFRCHGGVGQCFSPTMRLKLTDLLANQFTEVIDIMQLATQSNEFQSLKQRIKDSIVN